MFSSLLKQNQILELVRLYFVLEVLVTVAGSLRAQGRRSAAHTLFTQTWLWDKTCFLHVIQIRTSDEL